MKRYATHIVEGIYKELRRALPPEVSDIEALNAANKLCNITNRPTNASSDSSSTYESKLAELDAPRRRRVRLWIFSDDYLTDHDIWSMSEELRDVLIHNGRAQLHQEYLR
jgi:hypothetical protein